MGENEGWSDTGGALPNGLLPGATPVMVPLDSDRWLRAEERTRELIACIQPNPLSEEQRNAVADYVQQLIMKCFPCQVYTFGSVPLKTYLPDGDIDLTAFSHDQNMKDTWANQVRDMLENEEKNENAEFHVKEVQYIQAEVKIIKCLVENIVVDISFNQVGGLCTLCFLDEVDNLIGQNHLFKRSIILIKAWCYYESRILGAHHGLISTYALETLVLYIFHVFSNSFHGPLEVLYRFLEFFSNFDWDHFCVSLWGPVPISSLPDVTAEPPRKDSGDLLLNKLFLDACSSVYAVFPGGLETNGQHFVSKHFNVIDPLRISNNLGRSVSKGNFYRIRSAFSFGAKRLARLLDCPNENFVFEVNQFFMNTWERHGSGQRPDAAGVGSWRMRLPTPDGIQEFCNSNSDTTRKTANERCSIIEIEDKEIHGRSVSSQHCDTSAAMMPKTIELAASRMQTLKSQNLRSLWQTEKFGRDISSDQALLNETQKATKVNHLVNESHGRVLFARTRSSPELTDAYADGSSQVRHNRQVEDVNAHGPPAMLGATNRNKNLGYVGLASRIRHSSVKDISSVGNASLQKTHDTGVTESNSCSNSCSNTYHRDKDVDALNDEISSTSGTHVNQEEQEIINMMASASLPGFNSQLHVPFGLSSTQMPFSITPTFLASIGYTQRHIPGFLPSSFPLLDSSFSNVHYPHSLVSPQLTNYFPGMGPNPPSEASFEHSDQKFSSAEVKSVDVEEDFWHEQGIFSTGSYDNENGDFDLLVPDYRPQASVSDLKYVPPPRLSGSGGVKKDQQKQMREKHGSMVQNNDTFPKLDDRSSEVCAEERSVSSRFSSATHSTSFRSRTSSESSWDGTSQKASKSTKDKRSKRITPMAMDQATGHGKGKIMSEHVPYNTEGDEQEWVLSSNMGTDTIERNSRSENVASLQVPGNHISCLDAAETSGADSMMPFAPVLISPGSRQRGNESSGLVAFYPTGPPIPFLTMLPVYNVPEAGNSDTSHGHFSGDENTEANESGQKLSPERFGDSEDMSLSSSLKGKTTFETSEMKKSDILNSDFASHWQNLQFGRFCQNPRFQGPLFYPSPLMVPPTYLPGQHPYENPVRPDSTNMNLMSQLMTSYGQRLVPVTPLQPVSSRPPNMYQHYIDDMPRYRSGTGTYLPNPKVTVRERNSSGTRKGNHKEDRNDTYSDREGNWNGNSKSRAGMRSRSHTEKLNLRADRLASSESQTDNTWNSYRHESVPSYQSQNVPLSSNSSQNGVAYNTYPLAALNPNGLSNGPAPPYVMLYPFENNAAYSGEQLEFGSLGPVGFPGADEQLQLNEGSRTRVFVNPRFHGKSGHRSSPDQPSSPHYRRRV